MKFNQFLNGYLRGILFISQNRDGEPLDQLGFSVADIDDDSRDVLRAHALSFFSQASAFMSIESDDAEKCGSLLAMTQTGQGAGFWDGDFPIYGDMLTKLAKGYPEHLALCEADDNTLTIG